MSGRNVHSNLIGNVYQVVLLVSIVPANELKYANRVLPSMVDVQLVLLDLFVSPGSFLVHVHSASIYRSPPNVAKKLPGARRNRIPEKFHRRRPLHILNRIVEFRNFD